MGFEVFNRRTWRSGRRWLLPGLAVIALLVTLITCGTEDRPLNVLIIGIDTLRPDHLGCYGYDRSTSPNIDRLAHSGVVAERATSQAPWTLPSFASLFTSLYPSQHGATTVDTRMGIAFPTLAGILRDAGYRTCAIVNAPVLRPEFGLNRGFEYYDVPASGIERAAARVTERALEWMGDHRAESFFMFVHYFDPHLAYAPPAPYDALFSPGYTGPIGNSFDLDYFSSKSIPVMLNEIRSLSARDRDRIISLYDGEIAYTDSAIGLLLGGLRAHNLDRNTLIVLLSDHGEEFFEHDGLDHGHSLYNELIRVPLIFALPGTIYEDRRIRQRVRLLDLAPTILDLLGISSPGHFEGASCRGLLTAGDVTPLDTSQLLPPNVCFSEALRRRNTVKGVIVEPWKLIYDTTNDENLLFNLDDDPGEQEDVSQTRPDGLQPVEIMLQKALTGLSDTWYVRMVGGDQPHIFTLAISAEADPVPGLIHLYRYGTQGDTHVSVDGIPEIRAGKSGLEVVGLELDTDLTLAFRAEPRRTALRFDLRIDGRPAVSETYLGQALTPPPEMPFTKRALAKVLAAGHAPAGRPNPPCILVWRSDHEYRGASSVKLDPETRRQLRALGYIQ